MSFNYKSNNTTDIDELHFCGIVLHVASKLLLLHKHSSWETRVLSSLITNCSSRKTLKNVQLSLAILQTSFKNKLFGGIFLLRFVSQSNFYTLLLIESSFD